ncbi:PxKF domain-containing protein [Arthrobacter sp. 754]|uniref:PxKF domain-containing protein n=1 Tax=Arthrobacter sp. 754 TaxID=3156315 RepID=UPI00339982A0
MRFSAVSVGAGPGRQPRRAGFRAAAAVAAGSLLLASAGVAYADDVFNSLDSDIDAVAEVMALNVGGTPGNTVLAVQPTGGDGKSGCNLTGSTTLSVNLSSSNTAVATVSPSIVTFNSCGATRTLTITAVGPGSASVTASQRSNDTGAGFNFAPAGFTVNVTAPAPSNTAPVLTIDGVTSGASYAKGSVPTAVCTATDAEDGIITRPITLSAITGADAAYGVGSQEASCDYTDAGGLYVKSSVTYSITDATAPEINYTLSPIAPDGDNGWYQSAVALAWTVTDGDSPSTIHLDGCVDQLITADQTSTDYTCSATSSGGSDGPVKVSIKKDGTAPTVSNAAGATGTLGKNGWFTSNVTAFFTATDATSGLTTNAKSATSEGQGAGVSVASPIFSDVAGNSSAAGAASQSFDIDWTAPNVTYVSVSPTTPNANGWYKEDVVATFAGSDLISGLASPATLTATSTGEGSAVVVESPVFEDMAGNTSAVGAAKSGELKIDKTAPTATFDSTTADVYYGSTPVFPTCTASDSLSGPASCVVTGGGTAVGTHTLTATATDMAGNTAEATQTYKVNPWTIKGFYQPIDMGNVLNTVKNGSTVPAKFEVFAGDKEITDPSLMKFSMAPITCSLGYLTDDVETTSTGSTVLRYDATAGQFIYNWKTPSVAGSCYRLTMWAGDGYSSISASFKLK